MDNPSVAARSMRDWEEWRDEQAAELNGRHERRCASRLAIADSLVTATADVLVRSQGVQPAVWLGAAIQG